MDRFRNDEFLVGLYLYSKYDVIIIVGDCQSLVGTPRSLSEQ
jgi:hypothetical protein